MKLLSICVGLPREIDWKGKPVRTSIFKTPVTGRIPVTKLNLKGDQQSDLSVHGGIDKLFMLILRNITLSGANNFLESIYRGALSERTSRLRVWMKEFILATAFTLDPRSLP